MTQNQTQSNPEQLIKSASNIIWLVVIFIIGISIWGSFSVNQIKTSSIETPSKTVTVTITEQKRPEISADIASTLSQALVSSQASAQENLDKLIIPEFS